MDIKYSLLFNLFRRLWILFFLGMEGRVGFVFSGGEGKSLGSTIFGKGL